MSGKTPGSYIETRHNGMVFDELCGRNYWKWVLGSYLPHAEADEALNIGNVQTVLLYGPFASGKFSLLYAQAGEMVTAGYQYLSVDLAKVPEEMLSAVFDTVCTDYLSKSPCYLALWHLEEAKDVDPFENLYRQACAQESSLIIGSVTEDPGNLSPDIRKLFNAYYVGLPDETDRKIYFKEMLFELFEQKDENYMLLSTKLLMKASEGYNYKQLEGLIQQVKLRTKFEVLSNQSTLYDAMHRLNSDLIKEVTDRKEPADTHVAKTAASDPELLATLMPNAAVQAQSAPLAQAISMPAQPKKPDLLEDMSPKQYHDSLKAEMEKIRMQSRGGKL